MGIRVCHLTSVHSPFDVRIFYKQCRSLAKAGYDVVLIAPHPRNEKVEGITVVPFAKRKNRLARILASPGSMFRLALKQKASLYHFHDPELIFTGVLLKVLGKKVIYDIHEDNVAFTRQKTYLPPLLGYIASWMVSWVERLARSLFQIVVAETYYKERFPSGIAILNHPLLREVQSSEKRRIAQRDSLLYVGTSLEDRGAFIYPKILNYIHDIDMYIVGHCDGILAEEMKKIPDDKDRLHFIGEGEFVDPLVVNTYYDRYRWLAGLAIFPPTTFNMKKELTKLFEYMSAGIPIICSDFPVWRALIEKTETGILVDPARMETIVAGIEFLRANPLEAERMRKNGMKAVRDTYNWALQETKLLGLYSRLLRPSESGD